LLSLVWRHLSGDAGAVRGALDLVLRRKAVAAEALAAQRDAILGGRYPALQSRLAQLAALRGQIARKALAGPGAERLEGHRQQIRRWEEDRARLETEIAGQIPELNLELKLRASDRRAVALGLPEGAALIEFVRFYDVVFKAVGLRRPEVRPSRYLAFVLPAREPDQVTMVDLGEAEPIDLMIAAFRSGITGQRARNIARDIEATPDTPRESCHPHDKAGQALRAAVFDPLRGAICNRHILVLSPDGDLTRLPFEVLPLGDGKRLIDYCQISYVSAGRDVLRFGAKSGRRAAAPVVAADPDFDFEMDGRREAGPKKGGANCARRLSRDMGRGSLRFGRLPGTLAEGERVAAMLGVKPWLAEAALEGRIKEYKSPRILHLATHGFFFEDQEHEHNSPLREFRAVGFGEPSASCRAFGESLENPLLRSGLALAGANAWLRGDSLTEEAEDGLLTAEDVTGLDLLDTELVVLSACDTGLGQVQIGEGVFGLRRSFVLAGAKTLVMSLWKVPDEQTRELMEKFYRGLLEGKGRARALRGAQMAMKAKYPDPLFWGAFICQGDPGPLESPIDPQCRS
jgi:CHAT domain-containing protein